ncbi:MAG: hypothetical protein OEV76_05560 [Anaerolineae bacterium]|nr:hypothetical protein [Anaerolineae bacterium]
MDTVNIDSSWSSSDLALPPSGAHAGASDIFSLLQRRYPQVEIPGSVFAYVREQESNGHRIRRDDTAVPLNNYLQRIGVHDDIVSRVLDGDSRLVADFSYPSLLDSPLNALRTRLEEHFAAVFVLQQAVLDSEVLTGFNRHGLDHLNSVSERVLRLFRVSDLEPAREALAEKEAVIAGYLHDSGNLISRQYHGAYGVYLLTQFFSEVHRDEGTLSSFLRVLEAVLFHEVEIGLRLSSLVGLEPATLGLIIADKTDVRARRVSAKSNVPEAIRDAHTLVNLLTVDSRIGCREREFSWELHFSPRAEAEEVARFPQLLKASERVWVPQVWQRLYREHNVEYLFVFQATFLKLYLARLLFVIRSVFELYPQIQVFRLVVDDVERGISLSRVFGREDYEAKITLIGKNLFKENWEDTYLYRSLA